MIDALAHAELDGVAADRHRGRAAEPVLAQHAAHVVAQALDLLLAHRVGIDLEQDVRAALQIEAEHDVALRPFRPGLHDVFSGKKFGTANRQTTSVVSRIADAFQREK